MARQSGPDPVSLALVLGGGYLLLKPGADGQSLFQKAISSLPVFGGAAGIASATGNTATAAGQTASAVGNGIGDALSSVGASLNQLFTGRSTPPVQRAPSSDSALGGPTLKAGANYFEFTNDARSDPPDLNAPVGMGASDRITIFPAANHMGAGGDFMVGIEWWTVPYSGPWTGLWNLFPGGSPRDFAKLDEARFSVGPDGNWRGYDSSYLPTVSSRPPYGSSRFWLNAYIRDASGYHYADWTLGTIGVRPL